MASYHLAYHFQLKKINHIHKNLIEYTLETYTWDYSLSIAQCITIYTWDFWKDEQKVSLKEEEDPKTKSFDSFIFLFR